VVKKQPTKKRNPAFVEENIFIHGHSWSIFQAAMFSGDDPKHLNILLGSLLGRKVLPASWAPAAMGIL